MCLCFFLVNVGQISAIIRDEDVNQIFRRLEILERKEAENEKRINILEAANADMRKTITVLMDHSQQANFTKRKKNVYDDNSVRVSFNPMNEDLIRKCIFSK